MKIIGSKKIEAFSLTDIILSMAIFIIISSSVLFSALETFRINKNTQLKTESVMYFNEYFNAIMDSKNSLWASLVNNTDAGKKSLAFSNGRYQMVDGEEDAGDFKLSFEVQSVFRDGSGNITDNSGTLDPRSRKILINSIWKDIYGTNINYSSYIYVNDWNTLVLMETTENDFLDGNLTFTRVTNTSGGEVKLQSVVYADWCKPTLSMTSFNISGQGIAKTISAIPGIIIAGTGANSSGLSLAKISVNPSDPPIVNEIGTFDGYKTNAVFTESNYAYIGTDSNSKEVVIINTSSVPFTGSGYYDVPGNTDADSVWVSGSTGFVISSNKLYSFNLTAKTGSRSGIGSVTLSGTGKKMIVRGNYAYIATDATVEMNIVDISNPALMSVVGNADIDASGAISIFVDNAGTRAYLLGNQSSLKNEVFIIDITTKAGSRSSINSINVPTLTTTDIGVPENSNRLIISGTGSAQQYQVFRIDNEMSPVYCGGLTVASGVNSFTPVMESNGNSYTYVVTGDSASELKILKGGAGGGDAEGNGYSPTGEYISSVFDTNSTTNYFYQILWNATVPSGTTIKLQIRSGDSINLTGSFIGPDGTTDTYFSPNQLTSIPIILNNHQYIQYKVYFTSDTISSPVFHDFMINYQI